MLINHTQSLQLRVPTSQADAMSGAGRVPGPRGGAQGAALQVEGGADHQDPALGARLQLLWLQAYNRVPEAMRYR